MYLCHECVATFSHAVIHVRHLNKHAYAHLGSRRCSMDRRRHDNCNTNPRIFSVCTKNVKFQPHENQEQQEKQKIQEWKFYIKLNTTRHDATEQCESTISAFKGARKKLSQLQTLIVKETSVRVPLLALV
jgi:hypothetical protein